MDRWFSWVRDKGCGLEAIPIAEACFLQFSTPTTCTADAPCIIYKVKVGDPTYETGVYVGDVLLTDITPIPMFLQKRAICYFIW